MPGDAASLTTLATVKTELGLPHPTNPADADAVAIDTYLEYLIKVASEQVSRRCNREFHYNAAWSEAVPGYGSSRLILSHTPVWSVASVAYGGGSIAATDYSIADPTKGWIYNRSGWRSTVARLANVASDDVYSGSEGNDYLITYAGGYVTPQQAEDNVLLVRTLPYDLEHAVVQYVVSLYLSRGQDRRIASEGLLSYNVSYREMDELPEVTAVVRRYRRVGTGR